jgi:Kdo2-lipid IVA lauroyltransferase/acyltransferase
MLRNLSNLINSIFFFFFVFLTGILPFPIIYLLSDFLGWFLGVVFKYRTQVIYDNLSRSSIPVDEKEKKILIKKIYQNLADVLLEGIKSFTITKKQVLKRHKVLNPEITHPFFADQKSIIVVTGHIANWEWGSLSAGLQTPYHIVGFYKSLKNKYLDKFLRRSRARFGTTLAPTGETSLTFEKFKNRPTLYLMAADQNPWKLHSAFWIDFLGRKTAFLHGPEKHAKNNNYPVLFADIRRVRRGYYEISLSSLTDDPATHRDGEITELFAQKLESVIREEPANWLWTHKRWKHKYA